MPSESSTDELKTIKNMPEDVTGVSQFIGYIATLAEQHHDVGHNKEGKCHFTRLDTDERDTQLQTKMGFPAVCFDRYAASLSGEETNVRKERGITLMFLDKVSDAKNYNAIHAAWDRCESIADDFIGRMYRDCAKKEIPGLLDMNLQSVEYELASNVGLSLYGVIVTFTVSTKFCTRPRPDKFAS
jgi:hypothetical protein